MYGSLHMGIGYALTEDFEAEGGVILAKKMNDCGVLRSHQMPEMELIFVEEEDPECPHGARGVGEIGLVPTAPCIAGRALQIRRHRPHAAADARFARGGGDHEAECARANRRSGVCSLTDSTVCNIAGLVRSDSIIPYVASHRCYPCRRSWPADGAHKAACRRGRPPTVHEAARRRGVRCHSPDLRRNGRRPWATKPTPSLRRLATVRFIARKAIRMSRCSNRFAPACKSRRRIDPAATVVLQPGDHPEVARQRR